MRFLSVLNLILSLFLGFQTYFVGHAQVLCVEKDGQVVVETFSPASGSAAGTPLCCPAGGDCENCHDIYLGNEYPSNHVSWSPPDLPLQGLPWLQSLSPLRIELRLPAVHPHPPPEPPAVLAAASLIHLPSTVLLI